MNNYIDNNIGNNIGWLYFVNTLGAATACLVTGFYLFNHFQLDEVVYIAAGINVFVAIATFSIYGTEKHNKNIKLINKGEEQPIEVADFSLVRKAILLSFLGGGPELRTRRYLDPPIFALFIFNSTSICFYLSSIFIRYCFWFLNWKRCV